MTMVAARFDKEDCTDNTSVSSYTQATHEHDLKPLLTLSTRSNSDDDEEEDSNSGAAPKRRPSLKKSLSSLSLHGARNRSKSRERRPPQRKHSGSGRPRVLRTNSGKSKLGDKEQAGDNDNSNRSNTGRRALLLRSMSFSDRSSAGRRGVRPTLSLPQHGVVVRGGGSDGSDGENRARPRMTRPSSCRDLFSRSDNRSIGRVHDNEQEDKTDDAASRPSLMTRPSSCRDLFSNTADGDSSEHETKDSIAEMQEKIEHLKAKTELYKEEFKRVVQEKKTLLANFVAETTGLTEELTLLRRLKHASEEENRKLRATLNEVGVQPCTLASLTELDGLPTKSFSDGPKRKSPSSRAAATAASTKKKPLDYRCDVIKGPGLLLTEVHRPRPTLFALPGLRSLPFWTESDGGHTEVAYQDSALTWTVRQFEKNWEKIAQEYKRLSSTSSIPFDKASRQSELTLERGKARSCSFMSKGQVEGPFQEKLVRTAGLLQVLREKEFLMEHVPFGSAFFLTLKPGTRSAAQSSPMNLRIRLLLPILLPSEATTGEDEDLFNNTTHGLRVGPLQRKYELGKVVLIDDSYNHEYWNEGKKHDQVVLVVDLWHPDVTPQERKTIVAHSNNSSGGERQDPDDWSVMS